MNDIFADGIVNVAVGNGVVRVDQYARVFRRQPIPDLAEELPHVTYRNPN